jgi:hypothetical protein
MRTLLLFILFSVISISADAQDIMGKNRKELVEYMRLEYRDYRMRNPMNVDQLSFFKFEHTSGDKTLITIFNEKGICETYQLVIDAMLLEETMSELNANCKSIDRKSWNCEENGLNIKVDLSESEWFFILTKTLVVELEEIIE